MLKLFKIIRSAILLCVFAIVHLSAQNVLVVQNQAAENSKISNESPENSESLSFENVQKDASEEYIYYNLADFEVTTEKDRSYYSANSLSATRTNAEIKDTPATITVINKELMEDLNLNSIGSIDQVIASAVKEEDPTSDNALRFRGFQTTFQLFEFMPRQIPLNFYNVERADVIRGANSLIFGQSAPGGKVNLIAKNAKFNKDSERINILLGSKGRSEISYDLNKVLSNKLAARFMVTTGERDYHQLHRYNKFKGTTLELLYRPSLNTQYRLHLEKVNSTRHFASGTYKDYTGQYGVTGIPEKFPATSDVVDYISDDLLNYIINYNDHTIINNNGTTGGYYSPTDGTSNWSVYPYINIDSKEDFRNFYSEIRPINSGNAAGATISEEIGEFILGDVTHRFSETMEGKIAILNEKAERDQLRPEGGNSLRASTATWRHTAPDPSAEVGGANGADKDKLFVQSYWVNSTDNNESTAIRTTLFFDVNLFKNPQRILLGYDYDQIKKHNRSHQLFNSNLNPEISDTAWSLRTTDSFNIPYTGENPFDTVSSVNGIKPYQDISGNIVFIDGNNVVNYDPSYSVFPEGYNPNELGTFYPRSERFGETELNALWFALQGKYLNNKVSTLIGARYDVMDVQSTHINLLRSDNLNADSSKQKSYDKLSPSLGAIYWVNSNVGIFANHAASIQTPTSNDLQANGEEIPPQTGNGTELGLKFELFEGSVAGQIMGYHVEKKNDSTQFENPVLRAWAKINAPELFESYIDISDPNNPQLSSRFTRYGKHIADTVVISRGVELDLFYNPTPSSTLFLGYAYLDTEIDDSPIVSEGTNIGIKDGHTNPGTSHHKLVLNFRKNFKQGKLKGWYFGIGQRYYSESYAGDYYEDIGHQGDELWQNKVKDEGTGYLGDGLADVTSITEYDIDSIAQKDPSSGNTLYNYIDSQTEEVFYSTTQSEAQGALQQSLIDSGTSQFLAQIQAARRIKNLGPAPLEEYDNNGNGLLDNQEYAYTPGAKTRQPKSYELWLSDHFSTSLFLGWRGKINKDKNAPIANFHLHVDNAFNNIDLLARGINAYYTDSKSVSIRFTLDY